jgi:hypothetical protein
MGISAISKLDVSPTHDEQKRNTIHRHKQTELCRTYLHCTIVEIVHSSIFLLINNTNYKIETPKLTTFSLVALRWYDVSWRKSTISSIHIWYYPLPVLP